VGNAFLHQSPKLSAAPSSAALEHAGEPHNMPELASATMHDPVYRLPSEADGYLTWAAVLRALLGH
jgi:DNA (cytosine-5)-methyltransferase 1